MSLRKLTTESQATISWHGNRGYGFATVYSEAYSFPQSYIHRLAQVVLTMARADFQGGITTMHPSAKYFEKALSVTANGAWAAFSRINKIHPNKSFTPRWSDKPLLKSWEKTKPTLGWPRQTDSLCPKCVREARKEILSILDGPFDYKDERSEADLRTLVNERIGEIKATILERDAGFPMVKECQTHGHSED